MVWTLATGAAPLALPTTGGAGVGVGTFLFTAVIVIALAYFASRYLGTWQMRQTYGRKLRVLEGVPLGRDRGLYLVAVGKQVLVLGAGPGGVQLVRTIDDVEEAQEILAQPEPAHLPDASVVLEKAESAIRSSLGQMQQLIAKARGRQHE